MANAGLGDASVFGGIMLRGRVWNAVAVLTFAVALAGCSGGGGNSLSKFVASEDEVPAGYELVPANKLDDLNVDFMTKNPGSIDISEFDEVTPEPSSGYASVFWKDEDEDEAIMSLALKWSSKAKADQAIEDDDPCDDSDSYVMQDGAIVAGVFPNGNVDVSDVGDKILERTGAVKRCG